MKFLYGIGLFAALALAANVPTGIGQNDGLVKREMQEKRNNVPVHNVKGHVIAGIDKGYFFAEPIDWAVGMSVPGENLSQKRMVAEAIEKSKEVLKRNADSWVYYLIDEVFKSLTNSVLTDAKALIAVKSRDEVIVSSSNFWCTIVFRNGEIIVDNEYLSSSLFSPDVLSGDIVIFVDREFFSGYRDLLKEAVKKVETEGDLDQLVGYLGDSFSAKLSSGQNHVLSTIRV